MTRGDWRNRPHISAQAVRTHVSVMRELAGNPSPEAIEEHTKAWKSRAKPVQHEQMAQEALCVAAQSRWWAPGLRGHQQERANRSEAWRGARMGTAPGWPDFTLHIPSRGKVKQHRAVRCAVELKTPATMPAKPLPADWWLDWINGLEPRADFDRRGDRTHYGLRESQARTLRDLNGCGYWVLVAWEWEDALVWLDLRAGSRPETLPEGWGR